MQIASIDIARHLANIEGQLPGVASRYRIQSFHSWPTRMMSVRWQLRLGNWPCHIEAGSKVASLYGETEIVETPPSL